MDVRFHCVRECFAVRGSNVGFGAAYWTKDGTGDEVPVFNHQDHLFIRAYQMGCRPQNTGAEWECPCSGARHGAYTGHPVISVAALNRAAADDTQGGSV
jgi:hypothetical protein